VWHAARRRLVDTTTGAGTGGRRFRAQEQGNKPSSRRLITRREALRAGVASGGALAAGALLSNDVIARAVVAADVLNTLVSNPTGFVSNDTFDHTSTLRFLETRFGAEVPNLSRWRRSATGDLTSAFNFVKVDTSVPALPQPSAVDNRITMSSCAASAPLDLATDGTTTLKVLEQTVVPAYPVTVNSARPQEVGTARRPSGEVPCRT
jgi:phospholipase C